MMVLAKPEASGHDDALGGERCGVRSQDALEGGRSRFSGADVEGAAQIRSMGEPSLAILVSNRSPTRCLTGRGGTGVDAVGNLFVSEGVRESTAKATLPTKIPAQFSAGHEGLSLTE